MYMLGTPSKASAVAVHSGDCPRTLPVGAALRAAVRSSRARWTVVRLMPARCADNERSLVDALPGIQGPEHKKPPTFPK